MGSVGQPNGSERLEVVASPHEHVVVLGLSDLYRAMTEAERIEVVQWVNAAREYGWQDGFDEGRKAGARDAVKALRSTRPNHNKGNGRASVQRSVTYASLQQFVAHGVEQ